MPCPNLHPCAKCVLKDKESPMTDNEKVRMEILIVQKDEALAASEARVGIYRQAWIDVERENGKLREEKEKQHTRIVELTDTVMRLQEALNNEIKHHAARLNEIDRLKNDRTSLVEEANELYEKLGRILGIVNEVVQ
jgi:chromosome segregation ATPase